MCTRARCFFAERHGVACAIGMYLCAGAAALVDGAATLPEHRGHGCQSALLVHRFEAARAEGARVAVTRTGAGSASQRNLERAGMRVCRRMEVWGRRGDRPCLPAPGPRGYPVLAQCPPAGSVRDRPYGTVS